MDADTTSPEVAHPAVEFHAGPRTSENGLLLLADHASNAIPAEIGTLGLPPEDMARHIAYDVGVRGVTVELARMLQADALLSTFSRLVIDPNRGEDDPTLIMRLYDRSVIPGNRNIDALERLRRLEAYHRPYHRAIDAAIDRVEATDALPILVSLHSFTPALQGRPQRPWHIGLLWDQDDRLVEPLLDHLRKDPELCVGDNEPYSGQLRGDCMWRHGTERGIPHVLIEIRNDLITDAAGQRAWAERLAPAILAAIERMHAKSA